MKKIQASRKRIMLQSPTSNQQALLRHWGGAGAGAFLEGPPTPELADRDWQPAVRYRLGLIGAAVDDALNLGKQ